MLLWKLETKYSLNHRYRHYRNMYVLYNNIATNNLEIQFATNFGTNRLMEVYGYSNISETLVYNPITIIYPISIEIIL